MRGEGLRCVLETLTINAHVTCGAHVDTRLLGEIQVEIDAIQDIFVDLQIRADKVEARHVAHGHGQLFGYAGGIEGLDLLAHTHEIRCGSGQVLVRIHKSLPKVL